MVDIGKYEKLIKYIELFLSVCNVFTEAKKFDMDSKKELVLIDPDKFKKVLKEFCIGDVYEYLKTFRSLGLIVTEKDRFTWVARKEKSIKRVIAIRLEMLNKLKELTKYDSSKYSQ